MGDFSISAAGILSRSEQRLEVVSQNIANMLTPGYKRLVSFERLLDTADPALATARDMKGGGLADTGNPNDFAIVGAGFFQLSGDGRVAYTRDGQFRRDAEGRLVNAEGLALQTTDGADLVLRAQAFEVLADGVVLEDGHPVGKLALWNFAETANDRFLEGRLADREMVQVEQVSIRQGMLEASNVSAADEMMSMMEAVRRAEAAQRLVMVHDDLMGRVITAFAQS